MSDLPSGVVTFLLTDIEGSVRLWQGHPTAMPHVLERHDALVRAAVEANGGTLLKHRLEGDSAFAVFPTASQGATAACALQAALRDQDWPEGITLRVRVALHTGECDPLNADYFGMAVNTCARLRGIAHGGQTLVTGATRRVLHDASWPGPPLVPLGRHRLRDLAQLHDVYQLCCPSGVDVFPPLDTADRSPSNLPRQLTSFVGRAEETAEIHEALKRDPLVTLAGPGGCGKTRLALHVAAGATERFPDGVWLVDLSRLAESEADLVPASIATTLGLPEPDAAPAGHDFAAALCDHLRQARALLILDNCEHVAAASARIAERILTMCAETRVLATSRAPLRIPGERLLRLGPLPVPPAEASAEAVAASAAVRLFVDRARLQNPTFSLDARNTDDVARLCRRLEGLPLSIELAAALVDKLGIPDITARIEERLDLLSHGARTSAPRHRSLEATLDWSYELLDAGQRRLFAWLGVFAGFDLAAVEAVAAPDTEGEDDRNWSAALAIGQLVDRSLVSTETGAAGRMRYRMLQPVHTYARHNLAQRDDAATARARHAAHYLGLAARATCELEGPRSVETLGQFVLEEENIRAAMRWCVAEGRPRRALEAAEFLSRCWTVRGRISEGRAWLDEILAMADADRASADYASALRCAGNLAYHQGDYARAEARYAESRQLYRALEDRRGVAMILNNLANVARQRGDLGGARLQYEESLALKRELADLAGVASTLNNLGELLFAQAEYDRAEACLQEGLRLQEDCGNPAGVARSLVTLGVMALLRGEIEQAEALLRRSLEIHTELRSCVGVTQSTRYLGEAARLRGDLGVARDLLRESVETAAPARLLSEQVLSLDLLGDVMLEAGDVAGAGATWRQALDLRITMGETADWAASFRRLASLALCDGDAERCLVLAAAADRFRAVPPSGAPPDDHHAQQLYEAARRQLAPEHAEQALDRVAAASLADLASYARSHR